ncbi:MAG: LLM class flavin-dependent oxidoreductase [Rhodospirillaceae bacterium]|nr:LLM class flavin-dependent oxidoreductase [Rhodospirillaceae bacterium]
MRFGYHATMCDPSFYPEVVKAAEAAGFDSFSVPDSIFYPQEAEKSQYPYNADGSREFLDGVPFIDPFTLIAWLGGLTTNIKFTISVLKLAIRQPVICAKQALSLAVITNNRLNFGVGISPWKEDFAACDVPWEGRGRRLEEIIAIIRGFGTGDYFGFEGEFFNFKPAKMCPVPTTPLPILLGGHSEPALARAARMCDGWISAGSSFEQLKSMMATIDGYRSQFGRMNEPFDFQASAMESFSADGVKKLEDLGVHETTVAFRDAYAGGADNRTLTSMVDDINRYADDVIQKVR